MPALFSALDKRPVTQEDPQPYASLSQIVLFGTIKHL